MTLAARYGRKAGFLRHLHALTLQRAGVLRAFAAPPARPSVGRDIFVCKGNIARSAYAEARAHALGWRAVASAGLAAGPDAPATPAAVDAARARGIDLSRHRARRLDVLQPTAEDRLFVFELRHARRLARRYPGQVFLLGAHSQPPCPHIEDPFGHSPDYYAHCFALIDRCLHTLHAARSGPPPAPAVYVDHAQSLGSIAVIRSLGRAGYRVHAASSEADALGAHSRYASHTPLHPPVGTAEFARWFSRYIEQHDITAIIPSESLALGLGERLEEFHPLMPYAGDAAELRRALSKYALFESALDHGLTQHLPPLRLVDFDRGSERTHGALRFPAFIKTDTLHARHRGETGSVQRAEDPAELAATLRELAGRFRRAVVQGHVPGTGVGASFVIWDGEVQGEYFHRRLHEVPYTGGISSWRSGFEHAAMRADALARLRALGWRRGPAMLEYRLDERSGEFYLMELNARFWGSLHLPLYAGVDLPALLMQRFLASQGCHAPPLPPQIRPRAVSCRHLPTEIQHCWSKLKSADLGFARKAAALASLLALTLDPRVKSDLASFPGDRWLFAIALSRFARSALEGLRRRLRPGATEPSATPRRNAA